MSLSLRADILSVCADHCSGCTLRELMKALRIPHDALVMAVLRGLMRDRLVLSIQHKGRGQRVRYIAL